MRPARQAGVSDSLKALTYAETFLPAAGTIWISRHTDQILVGQSTTAHEKTHSGDILDLEQRTWLPRHLRGDPGAFDALLNAYQRPIYSYLIRCGIIESARDDLFQDIFLKIHAAASSYQPSRPLKPWIFTIAANTVRNYIRAQNGPRNHRALSWDEQHADPPDPQPSAETRFDHQHQLGWLEQAIAALPLKQREVLLLITVEGLPQQEVALSLNIPLNSVKTYLRRARLSLVQAQRERVQGVSHGDL